MKAVEDAIKALPMDIAKALADVLKDFAGSDLRGEVTVESGNFTVYKQEKASPKLISAIRYLLDNPNDMKLSSRVLADKIGVSHTWVGQAKKLIDSDEYKNLL